MSEYGPEQSFPDDRGDPAETDSVDSESPFVRLLREHGVTEAELDRCADSMGSYDLAYRRFGISQKELDDVKREPFVDVTPQPGAPINFITDIPPGPSLSLEGRAKALETIMNRYNKENQTIGAELTSAYNGMSARYGDSTGEVLEGMRGKTSRLGGQALQALMILSDGDSGIPMPEDDDYLGLIGSELHQKFGPGNARVGKRNGALTKAFRIAGTTYTAHKREESLKKSR